MVKGNRGIDILCSKDPTAKVKILVCYYQPWSLPSEDIFFPIQAAKSSSGYNLQIQGDDIGDNISSRNAVFGEFTAWYWGWKNIKTLYQNLEYIGLAHYRRVFALNEPFKCETAIPKKYFPEIEGYETLVMQKLESKDIILTKPVLFGVDLKTQYEKFHNASDYLLLKEVMHEIYPEYDKSLTEFFENDNTISLYCCFISKYNRLVRQPLEML